MESADASSGSPDDTRTEVSPVVDAQSPFRELVGPLPVGEGVFHGSLGDLTDIGAMDRFDTSGWGEPAYSSVYTAGDGPAGAAMTVVEFEGGLHHRSLVPGAHLAFSIFDTAGPSDSLFIFVVGCTGTKLNEWDFDQVADRVVVDVSAASDEGETVVVDYTAEFRDLDTGGDYKVTGSFEVMRPSL
jgi:hypothetical protein